MEDGSSSPVEPSASPVEPSSVTDTTEGIDARNENRTWKDLTPEEKLDFMFQWIGAANQKFKSLDGLSAKLGALLDAVEKQSMNRGALEQPPPAPLQQNPLMPQQLSLGEMPPAPLPVPQQGGAGSKIMEQLIGTVGGEVIRSLTGGSSQIAGMDMNTVMQQLMMRNFMEDILMAGDIRRAVRTSLFGKGLLSSAEGTKLDDAVAQLKGGQSATTQPAQTTDTQHPE